MTTAQRDPDDWWWILDPRQSLRARAVLIFGGFALVFSVLLGWTAETYFRRFLTRQAGPAFETLAVQIGDKLDRALDERLRALQLAANLSSLKNPATPTAERRAVLETVLAAAPDCAWIGFTDRDGSIVAAAPQLFEGVSVGDQAWFRGARRMPFAGGVREFSELARELANPGEEKPRFLDLAVPVNDARGNFLGVLGAHLRWSWARDTQHSVVSDAARLEHIGVTIYAPDGEALLDSGVSSWTLPPDAPKVGEKNGAHGYFLENVPGEAEFLTGYARTKGYRDFRGANWLITVRQPVADAFIGPRELHRRILWIGATFTIAIIVFSWLTAGCIARRMAAVTAAADRIRGGDILSLMPLPTGRGEIQTMCGALGEMVDDFRSKQERAEDDNTRLTARLKNPGA